ncbi:hypothetical protein N7533_008367 [Penicillium manginii]|uniref:uncharacterized protein n=1 Tax=Penicillium manginii TaxID=203109 RepID=UPI0025489D47|nr:uncharacterized protein N7533_008367 [Penicillium manginii]KAJ5751339.1 hypothetical protein N7533_008367 [Penicillium manginii]
MASSVIAYPLTERQTSITCSSGNQTPKSCQILVPVNILGKTIDIGVGTPSGGSSGGGGTSGGHGGTAG